MPSKYLTANQLEGLEKLGDIYVPGDDEFPSFRRLGCSASVDRILAEMPAGDRSDLRMLLGVCRFVPMGLLNLFVRLVESSSGIPGRLGGPLRFLRLGLRGLLLTLYYSGRTGPDFTGPSPLELLGYHVSVFTGDLDSSAGHKGTDE